MSLRSNLIRLAHANPDLRPHLLPILTEGREAGFSLPDPRGVVIQYKRVQEELEDLQVWSRTLRVGLAAAGRGTEMEEKIRAMEQAEKLLRQTVEALGPSVTAYYRSQLPKRPDPRTL